MTYDWDHVERCELDGTEVGCGGFSVVVTIVVLSICCIEPEVVRVGSEFVTEGNSVGSLPR